MSCHVAIIVSKFLKKSFSKTFLFLKIIYKYFAGFLACINCIIHCHYEGKARSNPQKRNFIILDCFTTVRNDKFFFRPSLRGFAKNRSNLLSTDCHADAKGTPSEKSARNDEAINRHSPRLLSAFGEASRRNEAIYSRSNLFSGLLHYIRNDGICRNDALVYIQFDKFQRFISVIYKKFITKGDLNYVKSQNNF